MNPIYLVDFYKVGHVIQYDNRTRKVWSNWTARSSRTERDSVVFFGLQYFIKKYLIEEFDRRRHLRRRWNISRNRRPDAGLRTSAILVCTHGIFSKGTWELLKRFKKIYTTDSFPSVEFLPSGFSLSEPDARVEVMPCMPTILAQLRAY